MRDAERGDLLPLLQFTLNRLFEAREGAQLTFAAYAELGGIEGAVDKEAENAISTLPLETQAKLGRLVRQLATVRKAYRLQRVSTSGLCRSRRPKGICRRSELVAALVNARILRTSGAEGAAMLSLAHARVLESWCRAKTITGESTDFYRIRAEVEEQFRRWKTAKEQGDF